MSQRDTLTIRGMVTSGTLAAFLELYDGAGTEIATGVGTITQRLSSAGPYSVLLRDIINDRLGNYRVFLQRVNNPCSPTSLACEQGLQAGISFAAQINTYLLQGVGQRDTLTLRMATTSGDLAPFMELFDGAGISIATGIGQITRRLDSAGPYTVLARDVINSRLGNYRLFLQRLNNPCSPASLAYGQNLADSVSVLAEIDTYLLQGVRVNDTVTLRMATTSGTLGRFMELFDGAGTSLASGVGEINHRLGSSGPYTLLARRHHQRSARELSPFSSKGQ